MPTLFNGCGSGPPPPFTAASTWPWVDHPVSGMHLQTVRPFGTRFPFGSGLSVLNLACNRNSPDRSTKSTRFLSYGGSAACKHRVSGSLSLPSRGPFHLSRLPTRFLVSRRTLESARCFPDFAYGAFTLSGRLSQNRSAILKLACCGPNPGE